MALESINTTTEEQISSIRVLDEYYQEIPEDLYIPPEAFAILLSQFEGPLDFLLYLVQKNGFDLKHLDIAPIAKQYLHYMEQMKSLNIELTADYMVMAALLADLKSRLLLPVPETAIEFEDDPKKQLIERLEHYLKIKQAAERLAMHSILERDVFVAQADLGERGQVIDRFDVTDLHDALMCIFQRPDPHVHQVEYEAVQLEERMLFIQSQLATGACIEFGRLLNPSQGRMGVVVTFVAVLELVKQQQVTIVHDGVERTLSIQSKSIQDRSFQDKALENNNDQGEANAKHFS